MIFMADQCSLLMMEMPVDIAMMRRALAQANAGAQIGEVPVGAVVYRGQQVLGEAHNHREINHDPTGHAEILALRLAARQLGTWRLEGCSLAVTLEPCPMCAGALINARVQRLIYAVRDPKMGCVDSLYQLPTDIRFNHRLEVIEGVLADQCAAVLSGFFQKLRRR